MQKKGVDFMPRTLSPRTIYRRLVVPRETADMIKNFLSYEPQSEEECLSEDETIVQTAEFIDGYEMDIKLCGVSYDENQPTNLPWCEAVLFWKGSEIACSEVCDEFFGEWALEYNGVTFMVDVVPERL